MPFTTLQVFLPNDPPFTWILAKMWFNNSDSYVHQMKHIGIYYLHINCRYYFVLCSGQLLCNWNSYMVTSSYIKIQINLFFIEKVFNRIVAKRCRHIITVDEFKKKISLHYS